MAGANGSVPVPLARAGRRWARWRRHRKTRRIPEELWALAAKLAGRYGVNPTAQALRVDYYSLKRRVGGSGEAEPRGAGGFVELVPAPFTPARGCLIEFEDPRGAKLRVHLPGGESADLLALGRLFLEAGAGRA
jgi:hypothetical protein